MNAARFCASTASTLWQSTTGRLLEPRLGFLALSIQRPRLLPASLLQFQQRFISKYISKSAKKRMPMTTKRAGKGFYKGKGATKEGRLNSKGKFLTDPLRQLKLVVPDLEGFALKPYVARSASKVPPEIQRRPGQLQ